MSHKEEVPAEDVILMTKYILDKKFKTVKKVLSN